jgi:hypothetical protein
MHIRICAPVEIFEHGINGLEADSDEMEHFGSAACLSLRPRTPIC